MKAVDRQREGLMLAVVATVRMNLLCTLPLLINVAGKFLTLRKFKLPRKFELAVSFKCQTCHNGVRP